MYGDGGEGSPIRAIKAAKAVIDRSTNLGLRINIYLVDKDKSRFKTLQESTSSILAEMCDPKPIVRYFNCAFEEALPDILNKITPRDPCFFFIDPCGYSILAEHDKLKMILAKEKAELLVNFMYMFWNRFRSDNASARGVITDESLQRAGDTTPDLDVDDFEKQIQKLVPNTTLFPSHFEVLCDDQERIEYFLVHFSQKSIGQKVMREIMGKAGKIGTFKSIPHYREKAEQGKRTLFDYMNIVDYPAKNAVLEYLKENYNGKPVTYADLERDLLGAIKPQLMGDQIKKALQEFEMKGQLIVSDRARRKGGFVDSDLLTFRF